MSDAKRELYLAAQRDALFVSECDAMDEPTCDHHGPWGCRDCPAWEAFKLRHAAARKPVPSGIGYCEEHSAHGYCCKCGAFLLGPSTGVRRVENRGTVHTAFQCAPPPSPSTPTDSKE